MDIGLHLGGNDKMTTQFKRGETWADLQISVLLMSCSRLEEKQENGDITIKVIR